MYLVSVTQKNINYGRFCCIDTLIFENASTCIGYARVSDFHQKGKHHKNRFCTEVADIPVHWGRI